MALYLFLVNTSKRKIVRLQLAAFRVAARVPITANRTKRRAPPLCVIFTPRMNANRTRQRGAPRRIHIIEIRYTGKAGLSFIIKEKSGGNQCPSFTASESYPAVKRSAAAVSDKQVDFVREMDR